MFRSFEVLVKVLLLTSFTFLIDISDLANLREWWIEQASDIV